MKGKVLSIVTAILFGATMVASPIVSAAPADTMAPATDQAKPAKKKSTKKTKKKATKKAPKKTSAKKTKTTTKKKTEPAVQ